MKKVLFLILTFIFLVLPVSAKTVKVVALTPFSTAYPAEEFKVMVLKDEYISDVSLNRGSVISGTVVKVTKARVGKRDGYFEFVPSSIKYKDEVHNINTPFITAKILGYQQIDKKELAIYLAEKATNLIMMGASFGVSFVHGFIDAEDDSRFKSGFIKMYKDSPLSWVESGDELDIHEGDLVIMETRKIH